jgi:hypothetical protein
MRGSFVVAVLVAPLCIGPSFGHALIVSHLIAAAITSRHRTKAIGPVNDATVPVS